MTGIHLSRIIQNIFTALKIFCALRIHTPPPLPPAATDLHCPTVSSLPERHVIGITQDVAYSDWLLSFNNMRLSFLHAFSWLHSSFLLSAE